MEGRRRLIKIMKTKNNLQFLQSNETYLGGEFFAYRIGTCHGLYGFTKKSYLLVAIINDEIGNGHFDDVLEWFENSAKRDAKNLEIVEIWNERLKKHLVEKRGFKAKRNGDVIKKFSSLK